ncbi:MAG: hypothetical protein ACOCRX_00080 [Candidatus Woesearchaeota archaeon]
MKINHQVLNFNIEKAKRVEKYKEIDKIIIGDFSCIKRVNFFLNERLLKEISELKKEVYLQLPLVVKENQFSMFKNLIKRVSKFFDGYVTGDLGCVKYLNENGLNKIIYTANVINKEFSKYLKKEHKIELIRPLMYKRTYIKEDINHGKDIIIYGNFMINCATFCFHSKNDLVENCKFNCKKSKEVIMKKELLFLIGRSLITENRLDLIGEIDTIKDLESVTIYDSNLKYHEIKKVLKRISKD